MTRVPPDVRPIEATTARPPKRTKKRRRAPTRAAQPRAPNKVDQIVRDAARGFTAIVRNAERNRH